MPAPHPMSLRRRVVRAYHAGKGSFEVLGELFGVGEATVNRWVALDRAGKLEPKPTGGSEGALSAEEKQVLLALVAETPDATLRQLSEMLAKKLGRAPLSVSAMSRHCLRLGLTRKKRPSARTSGRRRG